MGPGFPYVGGHEDTASVLGALVIRTLRDVAAGRVVLPGTLRITEMD